jgi:hypothetical protein
LPSFQTQTSNFPGVLHLRLFVHLDSHGVSHPLPPLPSVTRNFIASLGWNRVQAGAAVRKSLSWWAYNSNNCWVERGLVVGCIKWTLGETSLDE